MFSCYLSNRLHSDDEWKIQWQFVTDLALFAIRNDTGTKGSSVTIAFKIYSLLREYTHISRGVANHTMCRLYKLSMEEFSL